MVAPDVMISLTGNIVISSEVGETNGEHLFCFFVSNSFFPFFLINNQESSGTIFPLSATMLTFF